MRWMAVTGLLLVTAAVGLGDEPKATAVLDEARAALAAVHAVQYDVESAATGILEQRMPKLSGAVTLDPQKGQEVPKLLADAVISGSGAEDGSRVEVAYDGDSVVVVDHAKKMFVKRGMPAGARILNSIAPIIIREFGAEKPLDRESKSVSKEYVGTEKVGDAECDVVHCVFAEDGGEVRWHFSREDRLPRKFEMFIDTPMGKASIRVTLSSIKTDVKPDAGTFRLEQPDGFREIAEPDGSQRGLEEGAEAPGWTLKDGDGNEVSLKGLRGKVVLLDFWATWCGPCIRSMPAVEKLHKKYKGKPVAIYGMNCWQHRERRKVDPVEFVKEKGFTYPVLLKADDVARAYNVRGIPAFFVIGPDGKVLMSAAGLGPGTKEQIESLIDKTLKEMAKSGDGSGSGDEAESSDKTGGASS